MIKLAVDAMGGDNAPASVVAGVERARDEFNDVEFILFGDEAKVRAVLKNDERITLKQADEVITMNDEPVKAVRKKDVLNGDGRQRS